jgi:predicted NUDIX family phosphoesterase
MTPIEQVLVVERAAFDRAGSFQGLTFDVQPYLEALFAPGVLRFMPRPQAEIDPSFKQLIPYVLLGHGGNFFSYVRGKQAGEKRLVGQRSIGIGGHINPADDMPLFTSDYREVYDAAVQREVAEEVLVAADHTDRIVALLNDDSTDVGKVHLGIVHHWNLSAPEVRKREQMITQNAFMSSAELHAVLESLESWSRFCVEHLEGIIDSANNA